MRTLNAWALGLSIVASMLVAPGCSLIVDGAIGDGMDAGTGGSPCERLPDGTACAVDGILDNLVCNSGICDLSVCGDGIEDDRNDEDCDDGNSIEGDGCDSDCAFSCVEDAECDDGNACNGIEACGDADACLAGTPVGMGTSCTLDGGGMGMCREGRCVLEGCGDGMRVDPEECDDMNTIDGDGCDSDCTFTCDSNEDCDDGSVCTGTETCNRTTRTCSSTGALSCPDVTCAVVSCDPVAGCVEDRSTFDVVGDGHYSTALCGGDDCNDMDSSTYTGAGELCDAIDHDCDGIAMEGAPLWYPDCDEDGYAASGAPGTPSCDRPTGRPASCGLGGWTARPPTGADVDCDDTERSARPSQTAYFSSGYGRGRYDYNCDGATSRQYGTSILATCGTSCTSFYRGSPLSIPACGTTVTLQSCSRLGTSCLGREVSGHVVACR